MPAPGHRRTPLLPATVAGLALLLIGLVALAVGGAVGLGSAPLVDVWLMGVGLLVLLGAVLATILGDRVPAPAEAGARSAERSPSSSAGRRDSSTSPRPAPDEDWSPSVPRPGGARSSAFSVSSSIPAQFEGPARAGATASMGFAPWDEQTDSGMSLPFAAVRAPENPEIGPYGAFEDLSGYPSVEFLEHEVERLRERVRELEHPEFTGAVPLAPPPDRRPTGGVAGPRPPEPPSPDARALGRACTGCGSSLPGGTTDPLCWGCGRPLCATCYWRTKEGAAAHTCPACFARASGTTVSSGRGPPAPTIPSAWPAAQAATPPR